MAETQLAKPRLIVPPRVVVDGHQSLERAQPGRRRRHGLGLSVKVVRVAAVQQPLLADPHGHPSMTARVPMKWHEQNIVDCRDGLAPHPLLATPAVDHPVRLMLPLLPAVAMILLRGRRLGRRGMLDIEHMHLRCREVAESTGMVEVKVSQHDVTHIGCGEPKTPDVRDRRLPGIAQRSRVEQPQRAETAPRLCEVGCSQTGVDEHQPILTLKQQAVAHQAGGPHYAPTTIPEAPARVVNGGAAQVVNPRRHNYLSPRPVRALADRMGPAARREQSVRLPRCCRLMPTEPATSNRARILSRRVIVLRRRPDGGC